MAAYFWKVRQVLDVSRIKLELSNPIRLSRAVLFEYKGLKRPHSELTSINISH